MNIKRLQSYGLRNTKVKYPPSVTRDGYRYPLSIGFIMLF